MKNLGIVDRIIRAIIGVSLTVVYFEKILSETLGVILLLIGIVFLLTGLLSYCPIYALLGLSSHSSKNPKDE